MICPAKAGVVLTLQILIYYLLNGQAYRYQPPKAIGKIKC